MRSPCGGPAQLYACYCVLYAWCTCLVQIDFWNVLFFGSCKQLYVQAKQTTTKKIKWSKTREKDIKWFTVIIQCNSFKKKWCNSLCHSLVEVMTQHFSCFMHINYLPFPSFFFLRKFKNFILFYISDSNWKLIVPALRILAQSLFDFQFPHADLFVNKKCVDQLSPNVFHLHNTFFIFDLTNTGSLSFSNMKVVNFLRYRLIAYISLFYQ